MILVKGVRVKFNDGTSKPISNWDLDIAGKTGVIVTMGPECLAIKLDEHIPDLDDWSNILIWTAEDFEIWASNDNLMRGLFAQCLAEIASVGKTAEAA